MEMIELLSVQRLENRAGMVLLVTQTQSESRGRGGRATLPVEYSVWPCNRTTILDMWKSNDDGARGLVALWAGEYLKTTLTYSLDSEMSRDWGLRVHDITRTVQFKPNV